MFARPELGSVRWRTVTWAKEKITQYCAICGNDDDDHLAGASLALLTMSIGGGDPTLARRAVVVTFT